MISKTLQKTKNSVDEQLTLVEHLEELRKRLISSVVFVIIISCVVYSIVDVILPLFVKPVGQLVFISPTEAFMVNIKIAFLGGLFFSSPYVLYHIWKFVSVGLEKKEQKSAFIFGILSFILFMLGCAFSYFVILPIAIRFLLGFARDYMSPMISVNNYVSFVGMLILAFSLVFQTPLIMLFLTKIGMVTPQFLSKKRRHAIVIMFILAAILTPPDVITQCLMAGPLLLLYEIGLILSKCAYKPI